MSQPISKDGYWNQLLENIENGHEYASMIGKQVRITPNASSEQVGIPDDVSSFKIVKLEIGHWFDEVEDVKFYISMTSSDKQQTKCIDAHELFEKIQSGQWEFVQKRVKSAATSYRPPSPTPPRSTIKQVSWERGWVAWRSADMSVDGWKPISRAESPDCDSYVIATDENGSSWWKPEDL